MWTQEQISQSIENFKKRIETEKEYCEELYIYSTIRIMAHKYCYYVLHSGFVDDIAFDIEEKSWYIMGRALGYLQEDETSPCIDFNEEHKYAKEGMELALKLRRKK